MDVIKLEYGSSQEAWEGINEFFITQSETIIDKGGFHSGTQLIAYNMFIFIRNAWMDPEFNFTKTFNYQKQKWSSLVNNYIDFTKLELTISEVRLFEKKNTKNYNVSFTFDNSHTSGKGCLLSLTFSRRNDSDVPVLIAHLRSSEIVKRLPFDLLLLQRIGEYSYGDKRFSIQLFLPNAYTTAEVSTMYHVHRDVKKLVGDWKSNFGMQVLKKLAELSETDLSKIRYKIHLRVARVLQGKIKNLKPVLVKDLDII